MLVLLLIVPLLHLLSADVEVDQYYDGPLHPLTQAAEAQDIEAFKLLLERESLEEAVYTEFGPRVIGAHWLDRWADPMDRQIAEEQLRQFCPEKAVEIINAADGDGELLTGGVQVWDAVEEFLQRVETYRHQEIWDLYAPIYAQLQAELELH